MEKSVISMKTVCEDKKSFENESLDLFQIDQNSSLSVEDPKLKTKPTLSHFSLIFDAKNRPKSLQNGLKNGVNLVPAPTLVPTLVLNLNPRQDKKNRGPKIEQKIDFFDQNW